MPQATRRVQQAKKRKFLDAFAELGTITHAAAAAQVDRSTHYRWLADDPDYAQLFAEAEHRAIDAVEREILRRGLEGVEEPVFHGGQQVGSITRYSDTLLIFAAKGLRPEKYRERYDVHHVTESAVDAEIRRLSAELEAAGGSPLAGEARAPADTPG